MLRIATLAFSLIAALLSPNSLSAQQHGTAQQARAMLERAVVAVKADQAAALAAFNAGTDGFRDRDLYVFCNKLDGTTVAHANPAMLGVNLNEEKDPTGKMFGREILGNAREGSIIVVSYAVPRPGESQPAAKESFVTRTGELVCGVGYYK